MSFYLFIYVFYFVFLICKKKRLGQIHNLKVAWALIFILKEKFKYATFRHFDLKNATLKESLGSMSFFCSGFDLIVYSFFYK